MYERIILSGDWMGLVFKGVAAFLFGIVALVRPGLTATLVALFLGLVLVFHGVMSFMLISHNSPRRWLFLIEGIAGVAIGVIIFLWPRTVFLTTAWLLGVWMLLGGIFTIMGGFDFTFKISLWGRIAQTVNGGLFIIFGSLLIRYPTEGVTAVSMLFGLLALVIAAMLFISAYTLLKMPRGIPQRD